MMICVCCGFEIEGEQYRIKRGYVCGKCWNNPNNFFSEKILRSEKWKNLSVMLEDDNRNSIDIQVIKVRQKNLTLYVGKLRSIDILRLYAVCGFDEETLSGYQRELYEEKINDIYEYLVSCPIAIMPAVVISLRDGAQFLQSSQSYTEDFGVLTLSLKKGSMWIIDGQHRVGGFEKVLGNIGYFENEKLSTADFMSLLNYELPILLIDSCEAVKFLNNNKNADTIPEDVERMVFFIINKTHHRISSSLKDVLQYSMENKGVKGIPVIERTAWRSEATALTIKLNNSDNSPFFGKINISGARNSGRPIQLNSFVSSLKNLFSNEYFLEFDTNSRWKLLQFFWETIQRMHKEAFSKNNADYLILKTIGIYSLNWLCSDYLNWIMEKGGDCFEKNNLRLFLTPIENFSWKRSSSPITHYGGMSGVREVHSILLSKISESPKNAVEDHL